MRLFKDVWATLITAVGLTLALSVTQGWNWPFLASPRAGIMALGVVGLAVCGTSGWAASEFSMKDPFMLVAIVTGIVLLGAGVIGLFANTLPYLVVMMVATAVLWLIATTRHLIESGASATPARTA
jgi:uncharacterized membrane protein